MKRVLLVLAISMALFTNVNAQCSPNFIFTALGIPGVYPPELAIPGVPFVGMDDGMLSNSYSQTLTLVVLEDTTMDVSLLLPTTVIAAMNLAGISTVMALDVNHVTFDVAGLPNGLSYACDQTSCEYPSGIDGCILVSGTPTQTGNFPVPVNMVINAQIPPITDPILGTTIFAGMAIDLPSFTAVEYDLFVDGSTGLNDEMMKSVSLYPNPTSLDAILTLASKSDVSIYNILGRQVFGELAVESELNISKNDFGKGMFYIVVESESKTETIKLIIK
jgi:hypothetical protein